MTNEDIVARIRALTPLQRSLVMLQLASYEAGQDRIAEGVRKVTAIEPDGIPSELDWDLVEHLTSRVRRVESEAWWSAYAHAWTAGGENLMDALDALALQRLAH